MGARVLIVDDEVICSYFLSAYLGDAGYDVRHAASAAEAFEIAESFAPEILISDWMLRDGLDGLEVAKALWRKNAELKTIFMTGLSAEAIGPTAAEVPHLAILEKPLEAGQILACLHKHCAAA